MAATSPAFANRSIKRNNESGGERVALLIGNADYSGEARLDNPGNDVEDYSAALRQAGYKVNVKKNLGREQLLSTVADFAREIENNKGVALFHYAGHGIAIDAENYLVPLGVDPNQKEAMLQSQCIPANLVVKLLGSGDGRVNVVILDMCRTLPGKGQRGGSGGPGTDEGHRRHLAGFFHPLWLACPGWERPEEQSLCQTADCRSFAG